MNIAAFLKSEFSARWKIVRDSDLGGERRFFAGLELFCFPASGVTLLVLLPLRIIAGHMELVIPGWADSVLDILLSAAIGYITNYIAVEMLFKPYQRQNWHPLSIITGGYWKQGLVPRNKEKIGEELGHQIEEKLLNPEEMADELCAMASALFQNPDMLKKLCVSIKGLLLRYEEQIITFLLPHIEASLRQSLLEIITRERMIQFLNTEVLPCVNAEENRKIIAEYIIAAVQKRSPELTNMLKGELKGFVADYLNKKIPFGIGAETLADGLTETINWEKIEQKLREKLGEECVHKMIQEELATLLDKTEVWLQSQEATERLQRLEKGFQHSIFAFLHQYLQGKLSVLVDQAITSDKLWTWVEHSLFPAFQPGLETFIREKGKEEIIARLNLAERVTEAVRKQDVKEFHEMINSIAAQHLGAIQVLGYFLGCLVGFFQLLI